MISSSDARAVGRPNLAFFVNRLFTNFTAVGSCASGVISASNVTLSIKASRLSGMIHYRSFFFFFAVSNFAAH